MKNRLSLIVVFILSIVLVQYRLSYSDVQKGDPLKITTWDAFGYYMYLPGTFIYGDVTELKWLDEVEQEYSLTGGALYQANIHDNGNYVFKYLGGVAVLESPFFFIGHTIALNSQYKADGFSPPYQWSIAFGAILYCILALFLLRRLLLYFFKDLTVALTLLLLVLATNFIQYVSIDSAQSHAFIFPLYVVLLYATMKWHSSPKLKWAALIGFSIGLATISRPTEAIMIFIPILWGSQTKEARSEKWALVKAHQKHVIITLVFGIIGILPQLIYWKIASGSFIYDVGSKWFFLNPWFRVLFGFENGWFIYTPITILFVIGFFFIKKFPFKKSVIVFCLLNIWIVIAWSDWKYGATYSTRALVQSYPVFALAFAAVIELIMQQRWKWLFYGIGAYLVFVNLFQIGQYGTTVLHYRDMNRQYYASIYLNPNPTALDISLLDTDEICDPSVFKSENLLLDSKESFLLTSRYDSIGFILKQNIALGSKQDQWITINAKLRTKIGFTSSYLHCKVVGEGVLKEERIRLFSPINTDGETGAYAMHFKLPEYNGTAELQVFVVPYGDFEGEVVEIEVKELSNKK